MPATPTIIGALLGLGTQMYSNALRKLPYMRRMLLSPLPPFSYPLFVSPFHDLSPHCVPRFMSCPGARFRLVCGTPAPAVFRLVWAPSYDS
jgi:hypothetical protein